MGRHKEMDKLSLDMIQCEKDGFGCHYGKWKATQEMKKAEAEEPKKIVIRICENCGEKFVRHDYRPCKYCCDECRVAANYKVEQERKRNNGQA